MNVLFPSIFHFEHLIFYRSGVQAEPLVGDTGQSPPNRPGSRCCITASDWSSLPDSPQEIYIFTASKNPSVKRSYYQIVSTWIRVRAWACLKRTDVVIYSPRFPDGSLFMSVLA